jgi:hypothetical protein
MVTGLQRLSKTERRESDCFSIDARLSVNSEDFQAWLFATSCLFSVHFTNGAVIRVPLRGPRGDAIAMTAFGA